MGTLIPSVRNENNVMFYKRVPIAVQMELEQTEI